MRCSRAATIDAVYIAVPNDLHAEMTLIAARHGVHVLCEKPMAPTEAECMQMIRACEQRAREADDRVPAPLRGREPGRDRDRARRRDRRCRACSRSVFSMQVRDGNMRTQPRRGAGPLYDIGIYCVNAARYLFRAEPLEVVGDEARGPRSAVHVRRRGDTR